MAKIDSGELNIESPGHHLDVSIIKKTMIYKVSEQKEILSTIILLMRDLSPREVKKCDRSHTKAVMNRGIARLPD